MRIAPGSRRIFGLAASAALLSTMSLAQSAAATPKPARSAPNTYGTAVESYYRMAESEFTPPFSNNFYADYYASNSYNRFGITPLAAFIASPHLPSGALVTYFELDSCDFSSSEDVVADLYSCDYHGDCGAGPITEIRSVNNQTPNSCSWVGVDVSSFGLTVNNYGGELMIKLTTEAGDLTTAFSGVILGYRLQVAPAPAAPTFNDVQPSDFGYQYIEALAASGITGGCGGGNFCPNDPIKRSQMAVFLAKALGLYLPHY